MSREFVLVENAMLISKQGNTKSQTAKAAPPWLSNAATCCASLYLLYKASASQSKK